MTNDPGIISNAKPYSGHDGIYVGDGSCLKISHVGNANLKTDGGNLKLQDVLVVPNLKKNLLSVGQLIDDYECTFEFSSSGFVIKDSNKKILAMARKKGQLYALDRERHKALSVEKKSAKPPLRFGIKAWVIRILGF